MNESNPAALQNPTETPPVQPQVSPGFQNNSSVQYASFLSRFLAYLIDVFILGFVLFIVQIVYRFGILLIGVSASDLVLSLFIFLQNLLSLAIITFYFVYFHTKNGQSLGKRALHIRLISSETGQSLNIKKAVIRELFGRFISSLFFLLGYFWVIWDSKKQGWHDKIANSVVIKIPQN